MRSYLVLLFTLLGPTAVPGADPPPSPGEGVRPASLSPDFSARALGHIRNLVAHGPRQAASVEEQKAVAYVRDEFLAIGLRTEVEEFEFETFEIQAMELRSGGATFRPLSVAFDPYAGVRRFEGEARLIDPAEPVTGPRTSELESRAVVSASPANPFQLMALNPKVVVMLEPSDLARLKQLYGGHVALTIDGQITKRKSANVVAVLGEKQASQEILLSAHLDSYWNSPGASDNGSGIGALIELARHFKRLEARLNARMRFVAFGAEELGVLGSRAYLLAHAGDLRACALNLNIDDIGGPDCPVVETLGGVDNLPEKPGASLFPGDVMTRSWQGARGDWRLLDVRLFRAMQASNHPDWLQALVDECGRASGFKAIHSGALGSDQLVFTQAGIVSSGVGCPGRKTHGPEDAIDQVREQSVLRASALVACVVESRALKPLALLGT